MRRLRALLPRQARGGGDRPDPFHRRRLLHARMPIAASARDYEDRKRHVPDCVTLTPRHRAQRRLAAADLRLSPRRRWRGPLLVAPSRLGRSDTVHAAGVSVRGRVTAHRPRGRRGRMGGPRRLLAEARAQGSTAARLIAGSAQSARVIPGEPKARKGFQLVDRDDGSIPVQTTPSDAVFQAARDGRRGGSKKVNIIGI